MDRQAVGERTIAWKVSVKGGRASRVEFEIDGALTSTDDRAPYVRFVDARSLSVGRHTLEATAFGGSASRQRARSRVSIAVLPRGIYWGAFIEGRNTYGPRFGAAPWDDVTWQLFETHAGKKISIVHWGTDLPPWQRDFNVFLSMHRKALSRGVLPLVSMDSDAVPLREIAEGNYDSYLRRWAQQAKAWAHPFFLRWNAEMNGGWNSWGTTSSNENTPTDFVGAWRRFHDIATAAGADNITWVWCPNVDPSKALTPFDQLYPGDAYVDWTCLDGYNWGGNAVDELLPDLCLELPRAPTDCTDEADHDRRDRVGRGWGLQGSMDHGHAGNAAAGPLPSRPGSRLVQLADL